MAIDKNIKDLSDEVSPQQRLVRLTMEHPRYAKCYVLPSYEKEWVVVPPCDIFKAMKSLRMVAVDCEMVLCEDGTEEVVKVCVVDKKLKVKLETLVNPNKAVANYRTEITGVLAEDLVGVTCSLVDVQESMKKLLRKGTILIGHSLNNDMRALKIEHQQVIDTAYIFKYSDMPPICIPSLKNLCKAVLGYELRKEGEPHNCRRDAEAAMKLVLAKLEHGFDDPIQVVGASDSQRAKLLLHKIPVEVPCQELRKVFPRGYKLDIQSDLKLRAPFYSTYAVFKDECEAEKGYGAVQGYEHKDTEGRLQKRVYLKLCTGKRISFKVRKFEIAPPRLKHGEECHGIESTKRKRTDDNNNIFEKKEDSEVGVCSTESCVHVKEVDRLKKIVRAREEEIFNMQKILAALTRKHGL